MTDDLPLDRLKTLRLVAQAPHRSHRRGDRRGKGVGGRMEFVDHRPYFPGDDLRRVDWNAVARSDRVVVKRHTAETALPVHLLIDASRSMAVGDPSPLNAAKRLALALANVAFTHGDAVTVAAIGQSEPPLRATGKGGLTRVQRRLNAIEPTDAPDFARALRGYAARVEETGLVVVISDLLDPSGYEDGLRALARHEVAAIHLFSPELETPSPPRESAVTDAETSRSKEIAWNEDRRREYAARFEAFIEGARRFCASRAVRYARARTDSPLSDVLFKELRTAQIVA